MRFSKHGSWSYKTNAKLTPQFVAFRVGCPVETARQFLERMATSDILTMEIDENGAIFYDVVGRPPATGEPLSWVVGGSPSPVYPEPGKPYQRLPYIVHGDRGLEPRTV